MRAKLTKALIAGLKPADATYDVWDTETPGLHVRVTPAGARTFAVRFRATGRHRRFSIGAYPAWSVDAARARARALAVAVDQGEDPAGDRHAARAGLSVAELCDAYMREHSARRNRQRTQYDNRRLLSRYVLPAWGKRRADAVTKSDAAALHSRIGTTSVYEANSVLRLGRAIFNWARKRGLLAETHPNPFTGLTLFPESPRTRHLAEPAEFRAFSAATDSIGNPWIRDALWLMLLTGMRPAEALGARWEHVDMERGTLYLPITKANRPQTVLLSSFAVTLLRAVPRVEGSPFVFPSPRGERPLGWINHAWRTAAARFPELADLQPKDLRKTCASWLVSNGFPESFASEVLRHGKTTVTGRHYAHLAAEPIRRALEAYGRAVMEAAGKVPPLAKVRKLRA